MHVSLDFTAPFQVGDTVFTAYPPEAKMSLGGPAIPDCLQATISSIKIVFDLTPDNDLVVHEPMAEKTLTVDQLVYTLLPNPSLGIAAFMVECCPPTTSRPNSTPPKPSASIHPWASPPDAGN